MRRTMVIDDEINVVRALRRELVQAYPGNALAFDLFDDPRDARRRAREHSVDVATSDQQLPHADGIAPTKPWREIHPSAVRLIVSGLSDPALVARAHDEAHVLRCIVKPWSAQELLGAFREALGLRDRLLATGRSVAGRRDGGAASGAARIVRPAAASAAPASAAAAGLAAGCAETRPPGPTAAIDASPRSRAGSPCG